GPPERCFLVTAWIASRLDWRRESPPVLATCSRSWPVTQAAMTDLLPLAERLAPRQRPPGSPCGYHRWHDLLFIHWRLPPSVLRPVVPAGLDIDTWDGDAWLGVVAFDMTGVRPWWSPAVPG